mgnify:CR=1 FL=1
MVTDEGAIYVTSNRGYNWKAAVEETVSATLNRSVPLLNLPFYKCGRSRLIVCSKLVVSIPVQSMYWWVFICNHVGFLEEVIFLSEANRIHLLFLLKL